MTAGALTQPFSAPIDVFLYAAERERLVPPARSCLIEEAALFEKARAFLGGDLHVARRQQEHLVGDSLHASIEGVCQPAPEVDQPLRELLVGSLQVEDDGNGLLELVGDLLGVVEAARENEVDVCGVG